MKYILPLFLVSCASANEEIDWPVEPVTVCSKPAIIEFENGSWPSAEEIEEAHAFCRKSGAICAKAVGVKPDGSVVAECLRRKT